ncbi:MAG: (Fe-S)-binding protein [Candidatus Eisenbacteria bacterium]
MGPGPGEIRDSTLVAGGLAGVRSLPGSGRLIFPAGTAIESLEPDPRRFAVEGADHSRLGEIVTGDSAEVALDLVPAQPRSRHRSRERVDVIVPAMNLSLSHHPTALGWFDDDDAPTRVDLQSCIHCGLCLTACPTYRTLKIEPDSPRGRLYLMRGLAEGRIEPHDPLVEHLDNCLDCRACETVCPAGVPYSRLLEQTRGQINRRVRGTRGSGSRTPMRMLGEWVLRSVLPHTARTHFAASLLRLGQRGPLAALLRVPAIRRLLPRFAAQGLEMTPDIAPRRERALERVATELPPGARLETRADALVFRPAGVPKLRVAFHTSCVMEPLFPHIHRESVRLMVLAGCEVRVPRAQTCCGALHAHAGLRADAKQLARRNVAAFAAAGSGGAAVTAANHSPADVIVSHSAGCGAALREAGHLLEHDPLAAEALAFSARVRDVSEVLAEVGLPVPPGPMSARNSSRAAGTDAGAADRPLRVTYHDACHLAHAQKVREAPRRLLRALPGVEFVELPNSDWCCGSAGIYNLTHPDMADQQLGPKLDAVARVAPDVVVASNPGCLLHMKRGAVARGERAELLHLVELLGRVYPASG